MSSSTSSSKSLARNLFIDQCRGIALIMMAVFHFCYNLSIYGLVNFSSQRGFFPYFRFFIVTLFFLSIGFGLYAAHHKAIQWRAFWNREAKLILAAIVISIATYLAYPTSWIWFGVLHFIALASLLSLPLIRIPNLSLVLGVSTFVLYNLTNWFNLEPLWRIFQQPLNLPNGTQDLTRLVPWVGMVWIGIYIGYKNAFGIPAIKCSWVAKPLLFLSKHSLVFYLVHQIPLYGIAWLIAQAVN